MIVEKFKKLFGDMTEKSMQQRAEDSRPDDDVATAIDELERATKSLENTVAQFNRKKAKSG